jgi:preprotein translocase subunit SecB
MSTEPKEKNATAMTLPITIHAQYIKDFSFENPSPITSFTNENHAQPNISVSIQAKADNLGGRNFEVVLDIRIDATRDGNSLFVTELSYAGIISLGESVEEGDAGPLLMIESPRLLFPFARNILADVTRDGGFPPLMLAPVDFAALYEQQKNQEFKDGKSGKESKNGKDNS